MAILKSVALEGGGHKKELTASAQAMIMRNLQADQYKYPIKSFIRETVSNSVDAIKEKNNAVKILTGKIDVTDVYTKSTGDELEEDSKFDPNYYTLDNLGSEANDEVTILYVNKPQGNRDLIRISDTGVGIGGKRLKGFFDLGFSTKRLNNYALGCFGIGSKSALAPGAESYRMTTVYNKQRFMFDIYNDIYISVTPKFNETGINGHILLDGDITYYEETEDKNGTVVDLEIRNPTKNKREYINAVKDQLTYFDYVKLQECTQFNTQDSIDCLERTTIDFKTKVLYEDHRVIIPESSVYTKPHLLLSGVNYGVIDFPELELNDLNVCIGIKGEAGKVAVPPSRESIIYNQQTGDTMREYIEEVGEIARRIVAEAVNDTADDFLASMKLLRTALPNSKVINAMAKFAGISDLQTFNYDGERFTKAQVSHAEACVMMYRFDSTSGKRTTKGEMNGSNFNYSYFNNSEIAIVYTSGEHRLNKLRVLFLISQGYKEVIEMRVGTILSEGRAAIDTLLKGLLTVPGLFMYKDVIVPEKFSSRVAAKMAEDDEKDRVASMSAADKRKLLGTVLVYTPYYCYTTEELTIGKSHEMSVVDIADGDHIVGTSDQMEELLPLLTGNRDDGTVKYVNDKRVLFMAKSALNKVLKVTNGKCISILDIIRGTISKNKIIMIDNLKKKILTDARKNMLAYWEFLPLFEGIDGSAYTAYKELRDYGIMSDAPLMPEGLSEYFMKMLSIQVDIEANPDRKAEAIKVLGAQYDVIDVVDLDMYITLESLSICLSEVGMLLSMTAYSRGSYTVEEVFAIKEYLEKMNYVPFKEQILLTTKKYKHD